MKSLRRLWLTVAFLMLLTPLGILVAGTAWGEWSPASIARADRCRHRPSAAPDSWCQSACSGCPPCGPRRSRLRARLRQEPRLRISAFRDVRSRVPAGGLAASATLLPTTPHHGIPVMSRGKFCPVNHARFCPRPGSRADLRRHCAPSRTAAIARSPGAAGRAVFTGSGGDVVTEDSG